MPASLPVYLYLLNSSGGTTNHLRIVELSLLLSPNPLTSIKPGEEVLLLLLLLLSSRTLLSGFSFFNSHSHRFERFIVEQKL